MAALSQDRMTPQRTGDNRTPPIKAATKVYAGGMAAIDANGWAVPMATATTLKSIGRFERTVNNTGANGDLTVDVKTGIFRFANSSAGDLITRADVGADCYGVDDQTVAKTNGTNTRSVAGKVFDVDDQGVWVKFS